ncbi:chromosome segregation protein SMC [Chloroflexota bacterium]
MMPSRLKSLELNGYKTFASRTTFLFADTVTTIVGPNGSGKSNIADSLRWVLGEQSYRLLRGKKTEDMIFAGSENRPRAGMASATITFENSDGWLPIDFSEVAITRRAYRDGQNEYLINGQRVRLRDVSELLSQSGLAERTYTIIGQGLVDAALSLRADERRRLFEEAAGIGLHRSRREDALRRLDKTRRNLERVQDIITEIQPRLRSLERQARRANEFEQIKADLHEGLREWYGYQWHRSQENFNLAQKTAEISEKELLQIRQDQEKLDKNAHQVQINISKLRKNLASWQQEIAVLNSRREIINQKLAVAVERDRSLKGRQRVTQIELEKLNERLILQEKQIDIATKETERIRADIEEASTQFESVSHALMAQQTERAQLEKEIQVLRNTELSNNNQYNTLVARRHERNERLNNARELFEKTEREISSLNEDFRSVETEKQEAQNALHQAETAYVKAKNSVRNNQNKITEAETENKKNIEFRNKIDAEIARLRSELDMLNQSESSFSGYADGTRVLLKAARENLIRGTQGALKDFLDVPSEYELAVTAALGVYIDAVVIDKNPELALDVLAEKALKGAILPINDIKAPRQILLKKSKNTEIFGIASELIKSTPALQPTVELLLGNVIIVSDRQAARHLLNTQPGIVSAVTLKGEVFQENGPILTIGGDSKSERSSVLNRTKKRNNIIENISDLEEKKNDLVKQIEETGINLSDLHNELIRSEQDVIEREDALSKSRIDTDTVDTLLKQKIRELDWSNERLKELKGEISSTEVEIEKLTVDVDLIEKSALDIQEKIDLQVSTQNRDTNEELQSSHAEYQTRWAVAEQALQDSETLLEERRLVYEDLENSIRALKSRIQELSTSSEAVIKEMVELKKSEVEIKEEIGTLRAEFEPAELELETLESERSAFQGSEDSILKELRNTEHRYTQASIDLARQKEALESLRHRIEGDFGLVNFDYVEKVSGPNPLPLEGMVENLPKTQMISKEAESSLKRLRAQLRRIGPINPEAQSEYQEVKQRNEFLTNQVSDLQKAESDVREVIHELDELMKQEFCKTFDEVADEFSDIFTRLFGGGTARLILSDPEDITLTGIEIDARLPGRRTHGLSLLSGGERSLTAVALIFALLKVSPTPFCLLDEVDAMLDEVNTRRFRELLQEMSTKTQFVIVTHNRNTVEAARIIYGVTMGRDSSSKVLSLKLDEISKVIK